MWKRFLEGTLNFIMVVGGIVVVLASLGAMVYFNFLFGLIILVMGGLFIMLSCSGLGILVEIAYHLEAIERNTSGYQGEGRATYNSSSNTGANTYSGERREHPLLSGSSSNNGSLFGGGPWECRKCGCENSSKAIFCEKCGNKK